MDVRNWQMPCRGIRLLSAITRTLMCRKQEWSNLLPQKQRMYPIASTTRSTGPKTKLPWPEANKSSATAQIMPGPVAATASQKMTLAKLPTSEPSPEALDTPIEDLILEDLIASELPDDRPVYSGPEFTPELVDALLGSNLRGADDPFSAVINSVSSSLFNPEFAAGPIGFPEDYFVPAQNGRDGDSSVTPFAAPRSDLHDPGESMGAAHNVPETDSFVFLLMGLVSLAIHRYSMTKRKVSK